MRATSTGVAPGWIRSAEARSVVAILALAGLLLAITVAAALPGQRVTGRVVKVSDGDSFTIVTRGTVVEVRLFGVDCPELNQPHGGEAKQFTTERIADRTVDVTPVTTDQYGRLVGRVRASGQDLSLLLLQAGLAWHLTAYSSEETFAYAERHARAWRKGLWAERNPVPPWVARHGAERAVASPGAPSSWPAGGPYRGNVRSKVFHRPGCRNYGCKECTAVFASREEAIREGYAPAGCCRP